MATAILNDLATLPRTTHRVIDGLTSYLAEEPTFARIIASCANLAQRHALFVSVCLSKSPVDAAKRLLGPIAAMEPDAVFILRDKHEKEMRKAVGNLDLVIDALRSVQTKTVAFCVEIEAKVSKAEQYLQSNPQAASAASVEAAMDKRTDAQPFSPPMLKSLAIKAREIIALDLLHKGMVAAHVQALVCERYLSSSPSPGKKKIDLEGLVNALESSIGLSCSGTLSCSLATTGAMAEGIEHCGIDEIVARKEFLKPLKAAMRARLRDEAKEKEQGEGASRGTGAEEGAATGGDELAGALASLSLADRASTQKAPREDRAGDAVKLPSGPSLPAPVSISVVDEGAYSVLTFTSTVDDHASAPGDGKEEDGRLTGPKKPPSSSSSASSSSSSAAGLAELYVRWQGVAAEVLVFCGRSVIPGVDDAAAAAAADARGSGTPVKR